MKQVYKEHKIPYKKFALSLAYVAAVFYVPVYTNLILLKFILYFSSIALFTWYLTKFTFTLLYTYTWPYHFMAYIFTMLIGGCLITVGLFFAIGHMFFGYASAGTIYVCKNHPQVQIISRYWDMGAWGGGTENDDFEDAVLIPVTPHFKIEFPVNITKIDKENWVKQL